MVPFVASVIAFALFGAALGVGLMVRGRGIKGHCSGGGCSGGRPEHSISGCGRTIHLPQK